MKVSIKIFTIDKFEKNQFPYLRFLSEICQWLLNCGYSKKLQIGSFKKFVEQFNLIKNSVKVVEDYNDSIVQSSFRVSSIDQCSS